MDAKKNKERTIFDFVYAGRLVDSVTPTEEPDFKVKNADGEFGVEITEFYFTQSQARLINIPSYGTEILDKKKYRHKDDITPLEVKEFTVVPHDNRRPSFKVEGLMQEMPDMNEYAIRISELIERKNKLFRNYIAGLTHVNLIIRDYEHRLVGVPKDKFHHVFFQPQLEKVLMNADFREIFLVTQLGEFGSSKEVYIPLKMLFLVAEVFLFNDILDKEYPDIQMTSLLCAEYLTWRGAKNVYFKDGSDGIEVSYGNSGILISKDNGVSIRDYSDFALPVDCSSITASGISNFFDDVFSSLFEIHKRGSIFTMELCFDVRTSN